MVMPIIMMMMIMRGDAVDHDHGDDGDYHDHA